MKTKKAHGAGPPGWDGFPSLSCAPLPAASSSRWFACPPCRAIPYTRRPQPSQSSSPARQLRQRGPHGPIPGSPRSRRRITGRSGRAAGAYAGKARSRPYSGRHSEAFPPRSGFSPRASAGDEMAAQRVIEIRRVLVVLTRRMTPIAIFRRPRESGGPGLQPLAWPLWIPVSAGMTVRRAGCQTSEVYH